ncbi:redoxin domain-containing protein [Lunatibacter salilacus]|uniref:redoxin domain-containing protein n=1 Tax=Lunatibacter salilacus TaxID=2483804 RepID=UPI001F1B1B07|nr:redoxin domain-containing protein [Lunatibacter salilacus]
MGRSILFFGKLILLGWMGLADALGQRISNIELTDAVSGENFSWEQHRSAKGVVLIFSSITCPFSKLYEDRITALNDEFSPLGVVFALVNPHVFLGTSESQETMARVAKERGYAMPYLMDTQQSLATYLQVTKIPEAVVITQGPTGYAVVYKGAIDNNPQSPESAQMKYLENALTNLLARKSPSPASTRAVGCNIRQLR